MKNVLGIDIGGTNTKWGIISENGEVLVHESIPTKSELGFDDFIERIKNVCSPAIRDYNVDSIGIGAPNTSSVSGMIERAVNLRWPDLNLRDEFKKAFNLNVFVENDANISAVGEYLFGTAKDCSDFIVLTIGTGIGTGIYSGHHLVRGHNGMGAEGGHITIDSNGRKCPCGGIGHLEAYVGIKGIKKSFFEKLDKEFSFAEILDLYKKNDPEANDVINLTAEYLAKGLVEMQTLFLPKKIILGGGGALLGQRFVDSVSMRMKEYSYAPFVGKTQICLSSISIENGAIIGAASLCF